MKLYVITGACGVGKSTVRDALEEAIRPHVEYNRWFRKNKGKFPLFIDNTDSPIDETVEQIAAFINKLS